MFARLNVNGRQRTKSPLIYFLDVTVKIDAPSLSNDISWDDFPIQRELRSTVVLCIFTRIREYIQWESFGIELKTQQNVSFLSTEIFIPFDKLDQTQGYATALSIYSLVLIHFHFFMNEKTNILYRAEFILYQRSI